MEMETITGELRSGTTKPGPPINCWIPEQNHRRGGIIIFPGGGYGGLAEHEGRGYAEHFSAEGIACFVVHYRLGSDGFRHPAMLEDALAAINTVRSRCGDFGVAPDRLGVMGSSAGGHLAAHALVAWETYEGEVSLRPDFGILCYPVILSDGPHAHVGSMRNLAGVSPTESLLNELSCDRNVSAETPPCFIWHTVEDPGVPVENSMLFGSALRQHGISFEMHLYTRGGHGLGLGAPFNWAGDCLRWIDDTALSRDSRPA
jgi:acetyl esterase/lipase